jgi:hypothetical protein
VHERAVLSERPPDAGPGRLAEPLVEPRLGFGVRPRLLGEGQHLGKQRVGIGGHEPPLSEPAIGEAGGTQLHRLAEGRVVHGIDGVEREAHERRLDDRAVGEGAIEIGGVEPRYPVPERHVRRRRLLGLEGGHSMDGLHNPDRLTLKEHLPRQRGAVEPAGRDVGHVRGSLAG